MLLNHETYGDPGQQAIVVLHGLLGSHRNWRSRAQALASKYFVVCPDLRNHGGSPADPDCRARSMAIDVIETMNDLGCSSWIWMGHSLGGRVAIEGVLGHPERARALIVVDIGVHRYEGENRQILAAMADIDPARLDSRADVDRALHDQIPDKRVRTFVVSSVRSGSNGLTWVHDVQNLLDGYDDMLAEPPAESGRTWAGPTCFILGADSGYLGIEHEQTARSVFPAARFVRIPEAGHWVHFDQPQQFDRAVDEFLQGIELPD